MIITLFELGIWASYNTTKIVLSTLYSAGRYALYGYIPTPEELEKKALMDRINHLEEKVADLDKCDTETNHTDTDPRMTITFEETNNSIPSSKMFDCTNATLQAPVPLSPATIL